MSKYSFTAFVNNARSHQSDSVISITKKGTIGFSTKFFKDQNIFLYKYAQLLINEENLVIGIGFSKEKQKGISTVTYHKQGAGGYIAARTFMKTYHIDLEKYSGAYLWTKEKINGFEDAYYIELKNKLR